MAFHHYYGRFPYEERFKEPYCSVFIPEIGKTVWQKEMSGFGVGDEFWVEEGENTRCIFSDSLASYHVRPVEGNELNLYFLPQFLYLYNDEDNVYYYHVFWKKKHYAVPPYFDEKTETKTVTISTERGKCRIKGFVVKEFEGMEKWKEYVKTLPPDAVFDRTEV